MNRTLAALGLVTMTSLIALSASAAETAKPAAMEFAQAGPHLPPPDGWPGPRGIGGPDRRGPGDWGMRGPRLQMRLAETLSTAETLVGIRSDQLDVWRDYTSAVLDLVQPPEPPVPGNPAAGDASRAFGREQQMIREITARAAKAATLDRAITALTEKLTGDQLTRLGSIDLRFGPFMGPPPGPHGPMGAGLDGAGPHGGPDGPQAGPGPCGPDFNGPPPPGDNSAFPDEGIQPGTAPRPG